MKFDDKKRLYFAAPLFNDMERQFNQELADRLDEFFDVFLPQRDGGLMVDLVNGGMRPAVAAQMVFQLDVSAIEQCDALLIILDGRAVDEGAAFELGYAYALGKTCYGLQTDVRRLLGTGNNPMIDSSLERVFQNVGDLLTWARQSFAADHPEGLRDAVKMAES